MQTNKPENKLIEAIDTSADPSTIKGLMQQLSVEEKKYAFAYVQDKKNKKKGEWEKKYAEKDRLRIALRKKQLCKEKAASAREKAEKDLKAAQLSLQEKKGQFYWPWPMLHVLGLTTWGIEEKSVKTAELAEQAAKEKENIEVTELTKLEESTKEAEKEADTEIKKALEEMQAIEKTEDVLGDPYYSFKKELMLINFEKFFDKIALCSKSQLDVSFIKGDIKKIIDTMSGREEGFADVITSLVEFVEDEGRLFDTSRIAGDKDSLAAIQGVLEDMKTLLGSIPEELGSMPKDKEIHVKDTVKISVLRCILNCLELIWEKFFPINKVVAFKDAEKSETEKAVASENFEKIKISQARMIAIFNPPESNDSVRPSLAAGE